MEDFSPFSAKGDNSCDFLFSLLPFIQLNSIISFLFLQKEQGREPTSQKRMKKTIFRNRVSLISDHSLVPEERMRTPLKGTDQTLLVLDVWLQYGGTDGHSVTICF